MRNLGALSEILSAIDALAVNAHKIRQILNERRGWDGLHPSEAGTIAMELRHDFEDGAAMARRLEDMADQALEAQYGRKR